MTGADVLASEYEKPTGFALQLNVETAEVAKRVYHALGLGGTITMPLQETFWAKNYAVFTDTFGTPWEINCAEVLINALLST